MTRQILAIAGCFPSLYPRATRPLAENEAMPEESKQFMLHELEREIYIYEICSCGCICYLPEEVVRNLIRTHNWQELERPAVV